MNMKSLASLFLFFSNMVAAEASSLANTKWRSQCQSVSSQDHSHLTAIFGEKDFTLTTNNFDAGDCKGSSLVDLKLSGTFASVDGKIDFIYSSAMFTPHDGRVVFYLNLKRAFGYSDWKANVAKNVAGRSVDGKAPAVPAVGARSYDVYKLDGVALFFGKPDKTHDGTSEGARPIEFDMTRMFQTIGAE